MAELYFEGIASEIMKYIFLLKEYCTTINSLTSEYELSDFSNSLPISVIDNTGPALQNKIDLTG